MGIDYTVSSVWSTWTARIFRLIRWWRATTNELSRNFRCNKFVKCTFKRSWAFSLEFSLSHYLKIEHVRAFVIHFDFVLCVCLYQTLHGVYDCILGACFFSLCPVLRAIRWYQYCGNYKLSYFSFRSFCVCFFPSSVRFVLFSSFGRYTDRTQENGREKLFAETINCSLTGSAHTHTHTDKIMNIERHKAESKERIKQHARNLRSVRRTGLKRSIFCTHEELVAWAPLQSKFKYSSILMLRLCILSMIARAHNPRVSFIW